MPFRVRQLMALLDICCAATGRQLMEGKRKRPYSLHDSCGSHRYLQRHPSKQTNRLQLGKTLRILLSPQPHDISPATILGKIVPSALLLP